ncbi:glycosyltransferase [Oscillatoriales cyanobacterium LEGE 11467]|uniref:Glycosyltransferase n=1 Tax=Zarconia navalis LEGE 11467 TaxID=1828826 RepID=A0A928Z6J8_9CYAN|nr:glycosyltransferase [Zarconia navalis]MBE9039580.1 glycosyltransferase [Zarconia navalis LEGE 11467]
MKILFLDQSGKLGGAEISLTDVAQPYRESCLVGLFEDGPLREYLEQRQIPVRVLAAQPIPVRKDSNLRQSLGGLKAVIPLVATIARTARQYDLIYANTQKALVVGALASVFSRRPLVYHLRDILSADHFSPTNRRLAVTLANRFSSVVIANSYATRTAFIEAGGRSEITEVVYNGFAPKNYNTQESEIDRLRQELRLNGTFVVGHFSRLSPWKGQHVLLEALARCPKDVTALLVGDALFGEQEYVAHLHQQVAELGLQERVRFLGFRSDVIPLMAACDLIAHTSTAPEPFGRVIVEAMLCQRPTIAAAAGGALELVEPGKTGWLVPPGDTPALAQVISMCREDSELAARIAARGRIEASERFGLSNTREKIDRLVQAIAVSPSRAG